jgi:hypothetical protein
MKVTKETLKKIIKEELKEISEGPEPSVDEFLSMARRGGLPGMDHMGPLNDVRRAIQEAGFSRDQLIEMWDKMRKEKTDHFWYAALYMWLHEIYGADRPVDADRD